MGRHSQKDSVTEAPASWRTRLWDARHDFGYTMEASTLDECFSALLDNANRSSQMLVTIQRLGHLDLTMALKVAMDGSQIHPVRYRS